MATLFISPPSSSWVSNKTQKLASFSSNSHFHHPVTLSSYSKPSKPRKLRFSQQDEGERESSSVVVVDEKSKNDEDTQNGVEEREEVDDEQKQQELDWKNDAEFKKFMGNPSIEAAIKLEKKRADRKLKELDDESKSDNPIVGVFNRIAPENLLREKETLEKVEQAFKALDLNKLKNGFGFDTFFATDVRRFGDGGIFIGNLRKPIEEVMPKLEKKLSEAAGTEVVVWFMEEKKDDITKQIVTRLTANRYGVKLSPSFLVPSNWTGCLGVMNNYESLLPSKKALFDIPVARTASAYLTSLALAVVAFASDGSFNGGDNALFVRPQFFENNPLFSFIQYVIGPYADDLGNVLPYAVEGVGVPVDPLAFAGLLGMVVTSLNLLPCGKLEGGRIAQAMFGRNTATLLSFATSLLLGIGGLSGSVICLSWGLFATFFRGGEENPAKDEITP
ncbi:probable zinc metallopeptidase EGY3, chloroplastic isoform X2 [Spinacia oleracea]|uniref:Probable zinc metallopeptidase EGY3, chloroplastic isoform X2 n=1 Tax=Spinacia oleracea TaxID=3562 RepID=A0ABM3RUD0_SPIOL|nr:probable zinc metallopeptidase EGY3, chloroplastic isoform X2 [Spinacia oleracea]